MKVTRGPTVSVILLVAIAVAVPAIAISRRPAHVHKAAAEPGVRKSVIKVHTSRGVVTLPGTADSWEDIESALFLAEGIRDVELANAQIFPALR